MKNQNITPEVIRERCKKSQRRIESLKRLGFPVDDYFSSINDNNHDVLMKREGSREIQIADFGLIKIMDSMIAAEAIIANGGTIEHARLYRRWVMSMMFRFLTKWGEDEYSIDNAKQRVKYLGYDYHLTFLLEELKTLAKLYVNDRPSYDERVRFFDKETVVNIALDHYNKVRSYCDSARTHKCRGRKYIKVFNFGNVFVDDLQSRVLHNMEVACRGISLASTPVELYTAFVDFVNARVHFRWNEGIPSLFTDTYLAEGAYYTMKNMILFHDCRFQGKTEQESINIIETVMVSALMPALMTLISDNGFNFKSRMAELYRRD